MKRLIIFTIASLLAGPSVFGQCEPDTINCKDSDEPGQICPMELPSARVNLYFDEVITVIPPSSIEGPAGTIFIDYIVIDSVTNLPEGLSYAINADRFYSDTAYCVQIYGTPVEAGSDTLHIYVTPFLKTSLGTFPGPQVLNDTTVVMTVLEASGIDPGQYTEFHILPNKPNPFSEVTTLGFYTPFDDRIKLEVYSILGVLLHWEEQGVPPGEYNFDFNGQALPPGTYFYRVTNHDQYSTGKFIKTKR